MIQRCKYCSAVRSGTSEIYALVGDEKVRGTAEFETLLSGHVRLRDAMQTGTPEHAHELAVELANNAPPGFRLLYAACVKRTFSQRSSAGL